MMSNRKPLAALAAAAVAVTLAGCGGGGGGSSDSPGKGLETGEKGGTLYYLSKDLTEHTDPQRVYLGRDISNFSRLMYRSLVAYPVTDDADEANVPQPDLATDTGTANEDSTQWSFTLKDGVKWQDGSDITCEDLKYGVSRTFATDVITGGPNYILGYLDVPKGKDGLPRYNGPYKNDNKADFDKAVTCDGKTITYKFNKPFPDFPLAIASLTAFDPYKKSEDQGDKSNYSVFSSGPYQLDGKWDPSKGGTLVRNSNWSADTDDIRKALPDKVVFTQGLTPEVITNRLIADSGNDQAAISDTVIPPAFYSRVNGPVASRAELTDSPYVFYVVPNFNQIKNLKVRQALMVSTNREGFINALGGSKAGKPAKSVVNPTLIGYEANPEFTAPDAGDPDAAKKLLQESGEKMPYPIKFTYSGGTPTTDKAAAALQAGWNKAGFKVSLDPLTDTYYDIIQKPTNDSDVMNGGWGADWPSIGTVIPALFDSRINLTSASTGQDYGNYRSDAVNKLIDQAAASTDVSEQGKIYAQIDQQLGKDVAYIPTYIKRFYMLRGSKVQGYLPSPATSALPDLANIAISK